MARVPVPDDFDRGHVSLVGTHPNEDADRVGAPRDGDVRVDDRYARDLKVREDEDGRFVGCPEQYADAVAAFLGTDADADVSGSDSDATQASDESEDAQDAPTPATQIDAGECPWCDEYSGDGVPQHASAAHPDEWAEYKGEE